MCALIRDVPINNDFIRATLLDIFSMAVLSPKVTVTASTSSRETTYLSALQE